MFLIALSAKIVVTEVPATGDWIILSIESMTFWFWFFEVKLWDVPIPTLVKSSGTAIALSASSADLANLILLSLCLMTNTDVGNWVVDPTPTKVVLAIPIAWVPIPVEGS